jgi:hypothetical protein
MNRLIGICMMTAVSMSLLSGCGTSKDVSSSSAGSSIEEGNKQDKNIQVQEYQLKINGTIETLNVEMPFENDIPTQWSFLIGSEEKLNIPNEEGIIHTEVKIQDLDQDQTDEILFYQYTTGTAGATLLHVYKPVGDKLLVLFESEKQAPAYGDDQHFDIKYAGDYKVSFFDKEKQVSATIELNPEEYRDGADKFLTDITTWIDPVSMYEIKDTDGDGKAEIMTTQRVIGISHPDTLSLFIRTFSMAKDVYESQEYKLVYEEDPTKLILQEKDE